MRFMRGWIWIALLLGAAIWGETLWGQSIDSAQSNPAVRLVDGVPQPDASVGTALRNLASRAGVIFVGQVTRVEDKHGVMEVTFAVQQGVLNVAGGSYLLREWSGLWAAGQPRYRVGQRAMVFLHTPNAAGLSSPVDGMDGLVPLVPQGSAAPPLLDVRRLAARVLRSPGAPLDRENGGVLLGDAIATAATWREGRLEPARLPLPAAMQSPSWQSAGVIVQARPGELHVAP